jgi:hypothetical protein
MGLKYATFDASGVLLLRYDDAVNIIPEGAVAVNDELFLRMVNESDGVWTLHSDGTITKEPLPPPTAQEILEQQSAKLQGLTQLANAQKVALTARIGTLNDSVELEMATPEEVAELPVRTAQLLEWKRYAVLLGRVTLQPGWPPVVDWPVQPLAGMDLTVSASRPAQAS